MTVTNSIHFFGGQVTYKWGSTADKSLIWGTGRWGDGDDMLNTITKVNSNPIVVSNTILYKDITKVYGDSIVVSNVVSKMPTKLLSDSLVVSNTVYKEPTKVIDGAITPTDSYTKDIAKVFSNTITVAGDMYSEEKQIGVWKYVVDGDSTNYEDRPNNTWTSGTVTSVGYTSQVVVSTTWT